MDYSYYYEAARHALDVHAAMISTENMAWLKLLPYQHLIEEANVLLCHGSPVRLEEFEYIFAPEQARSACRCGTSSGTSRSSVTRTSARCSR